METLRAVEVDIINNTAKIIEIKHGDSEGVLGKNIVAVLDGAKHDTAECGWCLSLAMRIQSRVGEWGVDRC